jgi:PTH2 family peptidyl-tRNA hydrolase
MATKQVIVIRKDLGMRRGKECAQAAHASSLWLFKRIKSGVEYHYFTDAEKEWMDGDYAKITVVVNSEDELNSIFMGALQAGLTVNMVTDLGTTEFGGVPTKTCLAIGPDLAEKIDPITKHLKLY